MVQHSNNEPLQSKTRLWIGPNFVQKNRRKAFSLSPHCFANSNSFMLRRLSFIRLRWGERRDFPSFPLSLLIKKRISRQAVTRVSLPSANTALHLNHRSRYESYEWNNSNLRGRTNGAATCRKRLARELGRLGSNVRQKQCEAIITGFYCLNGVTPYGRNTSLLTPF